MKLNSKNVRRSKSTVRPLINSFDKSGHISKVFSILGFISPLNVLLKQNGATRLIKNFSRLHRLVLWDPKLSHLDIFQLAPEYSSKKYFLS